MNVQFMAPPPGDPLHAYVLSIFRVRSRTTGWTETILPEGSADLLFNLGGPILGTGFDSGDHLVRPGDIWLDGIKTKPYRVLQWPGMYLVGVSLRGDAAGAVLPAPPAALLNREECVTTTGRFTEVHERLSEAMDFAAQCTILRAWLLAPFLTAAQSG